jgi:hypothetical protein
MSGGRRMKKQSVISILVLSALTIVLYQNCSNQSFQTDVQFSTSGVPSIATASDTPAAAAPICRKIDAAEIQPRLLYSWDYASDLMPSYKQVMASPVVGDIDGDKIPEIAFVSFLDGAYSTKGILRVLNGKTGATKFSITNEEQMPYASTAPLLVDIDADGQAEIVYIHYLGKKVIALNSDASVRWEMPLDFTGLSISAMNNCRGGFAAADLDKDGKSEIIAGSFVIGEGADKKPYLRSKLGEVTNACFTYAASLATANNSDLRIIGQTGVMLENGTYLWKYLRTGFPATADLLPGTPGVEVVVSGGGYLTIYNGLTGDVISDKKLSEHSDLICRYDSAGNGIVGGGQATIGDFDGKTDTLEIAVATGKSLTIFNNKGEKIAGNVTQDCSSLVTGLTSFDFNGDGKPEIIYADEQYVRIYGMDGSNDLKVIWSTINPSGTLFEYPVVADVDGDGYAELVVVANNYAVNGLYTAADDKAKAMEITGLRVFAPTLAKSWMPTRAIWNQHAYLAANVNENLTATSSTMINGFASTLFKRNIQKGLLQEVCTVQ